MQLKISSITNLTDARFFSAIGAHYLGFSFDVLNENNIPVSKAKEIIQWLHEPVIVGEFGNHQTKEEIAFIAQQMELNEIQIPFDYPEKGQLAFEKFLVMDDRTSIPDSVCSDYIVIKISGQDIAHADLKRFIANNNVFIEADFTLENILPITESLQPYGIQITCRKEEKPGLSLVDEYAELLELIGFS